MLEAGELMSKMERDDYSGFEYEDFERILAADPKRCVALVWQSLFRLDNFKLPGCASLCLDLWDVLKKANAIDVVFILQQWPKLSWTARANICYAFACPELLSSDLGVALFDQPTSTVEDRHMIAGELYRAARDGGLQKAAVLRLIARIGRYDDPAKQAALDRFVQAVTGEFRNLDSIVVSELPVAAFQADMQINRVSPN